uniref:SFRICE_009002 n=1 Tax=Spodoptera frugiperda TaxID=7108 RepID=A0A2H1WNV8_SPOFR
MIRSYNKVSNIPGVSVSALGPCLCTERVSMRRRRSIILPMVTALSCSAPGPATARLIVFMPTTGLKSSISRSKLGVFERRVGPVVVLLDAQHVDALPVAEHEHCHLAATAAPLHVLSGNTTTHIIVKKYIQGSVLGGGGRRRVEMGPPRMPSTSRSRAPSPMACSRRHDESSNSLRLYSKCCWDTGIPATLYHSSGKV